MRNAGLEETQAGIKVAGRNINHLRYADETTFMEESEEELKSLLTKVKEESEKVGSKLNIQKTNRWGNYGNGVRLFFFGSKITVDGDCSREIKIHLLLGRAAKSLQSCPTLSDPIDGSPPGSPVPGILQARTLECVAISFSNA